MNRKPIFDAVRAMLGRGFSEAEVAELDGAIDAALRAIDPALGEVRNVHVGKGAAERMTTGEGNVLIGARHRLGDPEAFFAAVRRVTGPLDQVQVETVNSLLAAAAHWPLSWLAYGLATAWHEARLQPIEEWGKGKGRPYARAGKHGQSQHGRGLVQLTWDRNYEWADKALGLGGSLLKDFNRALEPPIATAILVKGMETGAFTGKGLPDYLPARLGTPEQFREARRIINGTDKAALIAGYAEAFQDALEAGGWQ